MIGDDDDVLGAARAAAALEQRIHERLSTAERPATSVLAPPLSGLRDHIAGPEWARMSLVVFGAYGAPDSRALGRLLHELQDADPASLRVAWRHFPVPGKHGAAPWLALAAEAAATKGRFWSMNRELLALHHFELRDVHDAARRADVDFDRLLTLIRAGVGAERVLADVDSAAASSVTRSPTLFVNGARFDGPLEADAVGAALHAATPA